MKNSNRCTLFYFFTFDFDSISKVSHSELVIKQTSSESGPKHKTKKPFRGNGTASNDCLPYEKILNYYPVSKL